MKVVKMKAKTALLVDSGVRGKSGSDDILGWGGYDSDADPD